MAELAVKIYYGNLMMLPDVARVLACLHEKDVVNYKLINIGQESHHPVPVDFLKLQATASTKVPGPAFEDGTKILFESRAICRYVSEKYAHQGNPCLLGRDLLERASIEQWLKSEENRFDPPSWTLVFHLAFAPYLDLPPDKVLIDNSEKELSAVLDVYEQSLSESKYLAGNEFTLADLSHLPNSHYLANSERWGHLFRDRKHVKKWWKKISERPSWRKASSILKNAEGNGKLPIFNGSTGDRLESVVPRIGASTEPSEGVIVDEDAGAAALTQSAKKATSTSQQMSADTLKSSPQPTKPPQETKTPLPTFEPSLWSTEPPEETKTAEPTQIPTKKKEALDTAPELTKPESGESKGPRQEQTVPTQATPEPPKQKTVKHMVTPAEPVSRQIEVPQSTEVRVENVLEPSLLPQKEPESRTPERNIPSETKVSHLVEKKESPPAPPETVIQMPTSGEAKVPGPKETVMDKKEAPVPSQQLKSQEKHFELQSHPSTFKPEETQPEQKKSKRQDEKRTTEPKTPPRVEEKTITPEPSVEQKAVEKDIQKMDAVEARPPPEVPRTISERPKQPEKPVEPKDKHEVPKDTDRFANAKVKSSTTTGKDVDQEPFKTERLGGDVEAKSPADSEAGKMKDPQPTQNTQESAKASPSENAAQVVSNKEKEAFQYDKKREDTSISGEAKPHRDSISVKEKDSISKEKSEERTTDAANKEKGASRLDENGEKLKDGEQIKAQAGLLSEKGQETNQVVSRDDRRDADRASKAGAEKYGDKKPQPEDVANPPAGKYANADMPRKPPVEAKHSVQKSEVTSVANKGVGASPFDRKGEDLRAREETKAQAGIISDKGNNGSQAASGDNRRDPGGELKTEADINKAQTPQGKDAATPAPEKNANANKSENSPVADRLSERKSEEQATGVANKDQEASRFIKKTEESEISGEAKVPESINDKVKDGNQEVPSYGRPKPEADINEAQKPQGKDVATPLAKENANADKSENSPVEDKLTEQKSGGGAAGVANKKEESSRSDKKIEESKVSEETKAQTELISDKVKYGNQAVSSNNRRDPDPATKPEADNYDAKQSQQMDAADSLAEETTNASKTEKPSAAAKLLEGQGSDQPPITPATLPPQPQIGSRVEQDPPRQGTTSENPQQVEDHGGDKPHEGHMRPGASEASPPLAPQQPNPENPPPKTGNPPGDGTATA